MSRLPLRGPTFAGLAARGIAAVAALTSCSATAGNDWLSESRTPADEPSSGAEVRLADAPAAPEGEPSRFQTRVIRGEPEETARAEAGDAAGATRAHRGPGARAAGPVRPVEGRVVGTFRNTYYDFPAEQEFSGEVVPLRDAKCGVIAEVPQGFHDAVCVQGSGLLRTGRTVSFAKRDCSCAAMCPRTGQKICYEALDPQKYPWGRGAIGAPITPLLTIAVDDTIVPMNAPVYIPELDGLPRDAARTSFHDGCFLAQDRGLRVKGQHVDVFTGFSQMTALWNGLVPSNHGVTVVLDSPRCAR